MIPADEGGVRAQRPRFSEHGRQFLPGGVGPRVGDPNIQIRGVGNPNTRNPLARNQRRHRTDGAAVGRTGIDAKQRFAAQPVEFRESHAVRPIFKCHVVIRTIKYNPEHARLVLANRRQRRQNRLIVRLFQVHHAEQQQPDFRQRQ